MRCLLRADVLYLMADTDFSVTPAGCCDKPVERGGLEHNATLIQGRTPLLGLLVFEDCNK